MSAHFRAARDGSGDELVSAINTTPLVDVMLVLLIIFLITIPVVAQQVALTLPAQSAALRQTQPRNVNIAVTRDGSVYWNLGRVQGQAQLLALLKDLVAREPQAQAQILGDEGVAYEAIQRVVLACQQAGMTRLAFVTQPAPRAL
jgi:biopolymer transport protein ExbD